MTGKPSFRQGAQEGNCRPSGVKDCINIHFRGLDACLCSIYSFTLRKEIVCSQTKNFFPHINSGYSACRGKNPPEMGIFRCTKRGKTAFLRLFRSIFLYFADKNLRTECWRFRLAGFTGKRKKRRIGGFRLLSSCEKAFRLSF